MRFFKLVMTGLLKIYATDKIFGKTCLKTIRDTFFSNMWSGKAKGQRESKFLWGVISTEEESSNLWNCRETSAQFHPLVGHLDFPIKKILRTVLGLFTVMIWKRLSDSIYFRSNKFTACKVKDDKEVAHSLVAFNLLKIIDVF